VRICLKKIYTKKEYQFNLERLKSILAKYGVKAAREIEEKIKLGEISEHPAYEEFLEAPSHEENMKKAVREIRKIVETLEAGLS
jgi:hypothetical protein